MKRQFARGRQDGDDTITVTLARTYPHSRAAIWGAFTSHERLARWFAPVDGDLRLGGRYQVQGNAGGTIKVCDPERRIELTWEMMGASSDVVIDFADAGDGSVVTLRHTARTADLPPGFWEQFGPGATGVGWELGFLGLGIHLDNPDAPRNPEYDTTWPASAEGVAFISDSARGWAAAATEAGEDAAAMAATVPALIGFYTGVPQTE